MIRFGIIGTNPITEKFIKAASLIEDFSLTAVYSRTEETARKFAKRYGVTMIFTDVSEMARSKVIDAVYIASPNSFHSEQAIICMNYGKHVLCEKPIASNTAELQKMITAAKINKVLLMEALKTTFLPNFQSIQNNLHKIGKVRRYIAIFCKYSSRYDAYKEGTILNAFNPIFSNGSLMDIGVYCIYPMVALFGKPLSIKANGILLESGVDGEGSILLKYKESEGIVVHSKIANSYIPSEIQGENGSILIDQIDTPTNVEIRYKDGRIEDINQSQINNSMYYEVNEFINLIKRRQFESSINSFKNSLITLEIIDEARKQIGLTYPADQAEPTYIK
ncbi:Predicted dehydrogenase [Bacillus sp. OV166]|uniref:Gfo/Idh/MocA family protein n=1 Tax=Bacillus sp. OV166 TaxID=1882763 RepID=UPI000A2AA987|nr:Gfo/Idh/MocA family oxidoreductase [Bacillus sp. OV166]SMQ86667.1 Predicted dehydrogenase [Bacillus sp. OV166]